LRVGSTRAPESPRDMLVRYTRRRRLRCGAYVRWRRPHTRGSEEVALLHNGYAVTVINAERYWAERAVVEKMAGGCGGTLNKSADGRRWHDERMGIERTAVAER